MKRTDGSQRNGLIFSGKKDSFNRVILIKDRQCLSGLPILFLYISARSLRQYQGRGKCPARTTACPKALVAGENKYL